MLIFLPLPTALLLVLNAVMALTNLKAQNASLSKDKNRKKLYDSLGLSLLVERSARTGKISKGWRFAYSFDSKQKTLSLGTYPKTTLKEARELRDAARELLDQGVNPSVARKRHRLNAATDTGNTVLAVATEWLDKQQVSKRTLNETKRKLDKLILPHIGHIPFADLKASEVLAVMRVSESAGHIETAHRIKSIISRIARYAVATERAETDVTYALKGAITQLKVENRAAITNPTQFGQLIRAIDTLAATYPVQQLMKIMPHLALRPGELRIMEWSWFDWKAHMIVVPAEHTKMRKDLLIPMSRQVEGYFKELRLLTGVGEQTYCFPSSRTWKRPTSDGTANACLARLGYSSDIVVPHGFRTTFSTISHEAGWPSDAVELQLAHAISGTRGIYNRAMHLPARTALLQWYSDLIDALRADTELPKRKDYKYDED